MRPWPAKLPSLSAERGDIVTFYDNWDAAAT
jgi:hypothetical protein